MDKHRDLATTVASELATRPDVLAVVISGSVGRGDHVQSSDVDLIIVTTPDAAVENRRTAHDGVLIESVANSEDGWLAKFDRPKASWLYAFLDGELAYDTGPAARLVEEARSTLATYRTSPELRNQLAVTLWHSQGKLDRAVAGSDPIEQGFWAGVVAPTLLDALYAIRDKPLPAGSRRLAHLHLLDLQERELQLVELMFTGAPAGRIDAALTLTATLRPQLGEPNLERW